MDFSYTPEELAYMERQLEIERQKCAKAIERQKKLIENMQPKGLSSMFSNNKKEIKEAEEALALLEDQYIELTTKTAMDLLMEEKNGVDKKKKKKGISIGTGALGAVGNVVETAASFIPDANAKMIGKAIGSLLKNKK